MKLHQVLALQKGAGEVAHSALTKAHHVLMKSPLLNGISKKYRAADDDDVVTFPAEYQKVQVYAGDMIKSIIEPQARLLDLTASRDFTNMRAKANVVVDGVTLIEGAPTTYLLWFEKQLSLYETFIKALPTLDPGMNWTMDAAEGAYASSAVETTKSKKVKKSLTLYPATDKHPAQVQAYDEDIVQGYWTTVKYSGALRQSDVNELLVRVRKLQDAVKIAIGEANSFDALEPKPGAQVLDYLFGNMSS